MQDSQQPQTTKYTAAIYGDGNCGRAAIGIYLCFLLVRGDLNKTENQERKNLVLKLLKFAKLPPDKENPSEKELRDYLDSIKTEEQLNKLGTTLNEALSKTEYSDQEIKSGAYAEDEQLRKLAQKFKFNLQIEKKVTAENLSYTTSPELPDFPAITLRHHESGEYIDGLHYNLVVEGEDVTFLHPLIDRYIKTANANKTKPKTAKNLESSSDNKPSASAHLKHKESPYWNTFNDYYCLIKDIEGKSEEKMINLAAHVSAFKEVFGVNLSAEFQAEYRKTKAGISTKIDNLIEHHKDKLLYWQNFYFYLEDYPNDRVGAHKLALEHYPDKPTLSDIDLEKLDFIAQMSTTSSNDRSNYNTSYMTYLTKSVEEITAEYEALIAQTHDEAKKTFGEDLFSTILRYAPYFSDQTPIISTGILLLSKLCKDKDFESFRFKYKSSDCNNIIWESGVYHFLRHFAEPSFNKIDEKLLTLENVKKGLFLIDFAHEVGVNFDFEGLSDNFLTAESSGSFPQRNLDNALNQIFLHIKKKQGTSSGKTLNTRFDTITSMTGLVGYYSDPHKSPLSINKKSPQMPAKKTVPASGKKWNYQNLSESETESDVETSAETSTGSGINYRDARLLDYYQKTYSDKYFPATKTTKEGRYYNQILPADENKSAPINVYDTHMSVDIPEDKRFKVKPNGTKSQELSEFVQTSLTALAKAAMAATEAHIKQNPALTPKEKHALKIMWVKGGTAAEKAFLENCYRQHANQGFTVGTPPDHIQKSADSVETPANVIPEDRGSRFTSY